ncbi:hypothetical protein BU17DRAFT_93216 [Hysterangium stoloniferum]|nr:hypothetical protein BU17DRAFT_93216 [Hysterangium stoloniferum]
MFYFVMFLFVLGSFKTGIFPDELEIVYVPQNTGASTGVLAPGPYFHAPTKAPALSSIANSFWLDPLKLVVLSPPATFERNVLIGRTTALELTVTLVPKSNEFGLSSSSAAKAVGAVQYDDSDQSLSMFSWRSSLEAGRTKEEDTHEWYGSRQCICIGRLEIIIEPTLLSHVIPPSPAA